MKILILGGGRVGQSLAEDPTFADWDITIVENNPDTAEYIEQYHDVMVETGDARDYLLLEKCNIAKMDAVVSVTASDEINVLTALIAKQKGVPFAAARIGDTVYNDEYIDFLESRLDIDYVFNPSMIAAENINCRSALDKDAERIRTAILAGGGRTALFLSQLLIARDYKVTIVVNGEEASRRMSDEADRKAVIVEGDINDKHMLDSIEAEKAGVFVAITDSEAVNVMLAKYADSVGVPYTAARASQREIIEMGRNLGIDEIIAPKDIADRVAVKLKSSLNL